MRILTMKSCKRLIHFECMVLLLLSPAFSSYAQHGGLTLSEGVASLNVVTRLRVDSTQALERTDRLRME